uniref:NTF2 domain-containing protein n=1 Tax=Trichuris muris TaxID=70415 RepID=A0A5S6Q8U0_TRIMR
MSEETTRDMTLASNVATLFLRRYHRKNFYAHLGREAESLFLPDATLLFNGNKITSALTIGEFCRSVQQVSSEVVHCDAQIIRRGQVPPIVMTVLTVELDESVQDERHVHHTLVLAKTEGLYKIKSAILRHMVM